MPERAVGISPQHYARIGGALYLIIIAVGLFGEAFVRSRLIVSGNVFATAANIKSQESLWRIHIAAEMFLLICAVALLWILFVLLKPVSSGLALLAVFFNIVSITLEGMITLYLLEALFPLENAGYLKAFSPEQLSAIASFSLKSHSSGFGLSLMFFGCFCIVIGYLILRSGFLPKILGVLMQLAGLCYLTNSFALILSPAVANRLFPAILAPALIAEASLCLWLLVKGLDAPRWRAKAGSRESGAFGQPSV